MVEATLAAGLRAPLVERRRRLEATLLELGETHHLLHLLQEVDAALERMDNGFFGLCEVCHEAIEADRLLADPLVRVCLDHLTASQQRMLELDLELAARIQRALLPQNDLRSGGWEASYRYAPAGPVSGDYCDLVPLAGSAFLFVIGDVSGKGVAASMLMTHLHALFHSLAAPDLPVSELVARANRLFCKGTLSTHYATLACGRARASGLVELCNAGHCPPLLARGHEVRPIEATGLPIGLFAEATYATYEFTMRPGESLVFYTDGLSEAQHGDAFYGTERLIRLVAEHRGRAPRAVLDACLDDADAFLQDAPRTDDLTLMALRRTP